MCSIPAKTMMARRILFTFVLATWSVDSALALEFDRSRAIQSATEATVLIKTHLKHGFLEDDQATGRWEGSGFLIDKEEGWILTNAHVAGFYKHSLKNEGISVKTGTIFHWPVEKKSEGISEVLPRMKADIILESSLKRLVIDTKFNQIYTSNWMRERSLRSGYLYQIYSYLRTQEHASDQKSLSSSGLLLHPSVGESVYEQIVMQGHQLSFATIDLTKTGGDIKQTLREIYQRATSA